MDSSTASEKKLIL